MSVSWIKRERCDDAGAWTNAGQAGVQLSQPAVSLEETFIASSCPLAEWRASGMGTLTRRILEIPAWGWFIQCFEDGQRIEFRRWKGVTDKPFAPGAFFRVG